MSKRATAVGAGFAGVEAAAQLSRAGIAVDLYEMKPVRYSPAHKSPDFAELICSNSFKAKRVGSAAGLMKEEMSQFHSLCVSCAQETAVPAGGSLSVDRAAFSRMVTEAIEGDPNITVHREEVTKIPDEGDAVIIAAGPLASDALAADIEQLCGDSLHFFDAVAPIVSGDSVDMSRAFCQSRYARGGDDD